MIENIDLTYKNQGFFVIGIDEAGRGPLCGPVTVAAVYLHEFIEGLDDSKKLTEKKRLELAEEIKKKSIWQVYSVLPSIIDEKNILQATLWGMSKVGQKVASKIDNKIIILIDGNKTTNKFQNEKAIVKGDSKSASIAAASILAKVHRDKIMERWHTFYPGYNLNENKGYPTKDHYEAIARNGILPIHRKSFKLIKKDAPEQLKLF